MVNVRGGSFERTVGGGWRGSLVALVAVFLATACGSTVPVAAGGGTMQEPAAAGAADFGLGSPPPGAQGDVAGDQSGLTGATSSAVAGGPATAGAGPDRSNAAAGDPTASTVSPTGELRTGRERPRAGGQVRTGPGITDDKVFVGVVEVRNPGEANAAVGAANVTSGNPNLHRDAMIRWINRNGGLAGRKLVPVKHEVDETSAETQARQEEEACATWTQDNTVFAVMAGGSDVLRACLARRGVVQIGEGLSEADSRTYQQFPYYFNPGAMRLDRQVKVYADGLVADGFFDDGAVLGVVTFDTPAFARAVDGGLVPALKRHGVEPKEIARVQYSATLSEVGPTSAGISNAVLRFRQSGVTHVMFVERSALLAGLWMREAESQLYRPRYGLTSQSAPQVLTGLVDPAQLERSLGIGWLPFVDVGDSRATQVPPWFPSCLRIMTKAGGKYPSDDPNTKRGAGSFCEAYRLLKAGLDGAGKDLTAEGFARAVAALGSSFQSSHTYATDFTSRRDGAAAVRPLAYRRDCACFRYSGPLRRVGG